MRARSVFLVCPTGDGMDHGFLPSGLGLECLAAGACGLHVEPGEPGWESAQACYVVRNPGVVEVAEAREARRAALHKLSFAAGQILDNIALFDQPGVYDVAKLDPDARGAAAKIATTARTLATDIKRTIDSLREDS